MSQTQRPLSVTIGRIVLRALILIVIAWGVYRGYQGYQRYKLAKEIAPVHDFAKNIIMDLRGGNFFGVQEKIVPKLQQDISIDAIAYFAETADMNRTKQIKWGKWNKEINSTHAFYTINGKLMYDKNISKGLKLVISKENNNSLLQGIQIGSNKLRPSGSFKRP